MINITIERKGKNIDFDIDTKFRTAILGENGIGKSTILKSIADKKATEDWVSVFVPAKTKILYFSQIEKTDLPISGGEHTKQRIEKLFAQKADLYVLDEPTNNLDKANVEWLKKHIIENNLRIIFSSHDIQFIDDIAEVIFYLDSKSVEKSKETCSSYLITRKKKVERAFVEYEINLKKHDQLQDAAAALKEKSDAGTKWVNEDKFLQGFKRDMAGKCGSFRAKKIKERAEEIDIKEPEFDPIPKVTLGSDEKVKDILFSVSSKTIRDKKINFSVSAKNKVIITGENGSGKTTFIKKLLSYLNKSKKSEADESFSTNCQFSYLYISQKWYEEVDEKIVKEYLAEFGLSEQNMYRSISYNHLDQKVINRKFKELSLGIRIKILLGVLSLNKYDLIIWDEPTNHLDVMTQYILHQAFIDYNGALLIITHDTKLLKDETFIKIGI